MPGTHNYWLSSLGVVIRPPSPHFCSESHHFLPEDLILAVGPGVISGYLCMGKSKNEGFNYIF